MLGDVFDSTIRNPTYSKRVQFEHVEERARVSVFLLGSLASTENGLACVIIKRNTVETQTGFKCVLDRVFAPCIPYILARILVNAIN